MVVSSLTTVWHVKFGDTKDTGFLTSDESIKKKKRVTKHLSQKRGERPWTGTMLTPESGFH